MGLIEALLGNPLLLFFVIAALLSLFRNAGGNNQEEQKRSRRPASGRNTQGQDEVDWREIFQQEQQPAKPSPLEETRTASRETVEETYSIPESVAKEQDKANRELQERYEQVQRRKKLAMEMADKQQDSPIYSNDISNSKVHLNFKKISREEAIKGIIWSEILGKPKARKLR
ncbi:hypothetical protein J2S74_001729 [Evansella vedderi]|uniref:Uncharacterized protein n=1 Tax=Evansella vedderi TaxID=38282 RepID=A0ABT9ZSZ0_9BACI|nr:hypothetical protein [Evansella vedderi]MDQ0254354.1 hypothetical protein [Evansella vedderi]